MAKDNLGQEFTVGDYVFYATGSGYSSVIKFARVVKDEHSQKLVTSHGYGKSTQQLTDVWKVGVKELLANGRAYKVWDSAQSKHVLSEARTSYPTVSNMLKASPEQVELCLAKIVED